MKVSVEIKDYPMPEEAQLEQANTDREAIVAALEVVGRLGVPGKEVLQKALSRVDRARSEAAGLRVEE